jgi:hypothetical protein
MWSFTMGVLVTSTLAAAAFFWRFWRRTGDRFFLLFSVAFSAMAALRGVQAVLGREEEGAGLYGVRLLAFLLILWAILEKNRAAPARPPPEP